MSDSCVVCSSLHPTIFLTFVLSLSFLSFFLPLCRDLAKLLGVQVLQQQCGISASDEWLLQLLRKQYQNEQLEQEDMTPQQKQLNKSVAAYAAKQLGIPKNQIAGDDS